ncbi:hypothetical protein DACRYDRAFT_15043 [Dacryopinax primogenitus]|uniref:Uncharacterized protein n=1 Tax=Dacryopinax primogenitus (strain DJM 731) TaxID=1858805 RepID=M5FYL8_DACPD|nr:uncharacterized protein DACRYDRAFT_15043 [Dacryopinax primogenitus]EJU03136.1 hypothetical protein DACRYDRAFT_15043 [Dacryopinax primogenitus]
MTTVTFRQISRTIVLLSRTQLGAPPPQAGPFAGMTRMQTFSHTRTFSSSGVTREESAPSAKDEQTSPQGPSTDEIAKSDSAFSPHTADPNQAKRGIENETHQSMNSSAASEQASKPPKRPLQTSESEAQKSSSSND